jgi:rhamnosyltransferase
MSDATLASTSPANARVLVLLATHNGEPWLEDLLSSLWAQQDVSLRVVASDDGSTDRTPALLSVHAAEQPLQQLSPAKNLGACGNFMRLVREVQACDAQYIAFADQDDVWLTQKLARAIECLKAHQCDGYSSSFEAWYPEHDRRVFVSKHAPQTSHDHLLQSPGPGCSFVLSRALFDVLQQWAISAQDKTKNVFYHDWLIYAFARQNGWRWHIDSQSQLLYRQHERNLSGSGTGMAANWLRLRKMRSGWWCGEILAIANALGLQDQWPGTAFARLNVTDRFGLALRAKHLCRSTRDRIALAATLLLGILQRPAR